MIKAVKNLNEDLKEKFDDELESIDDIMNEVLDEMYINELIRSNEHFRNIETVRCAAHTFQLGVQDFFKNIKLNFGQLKEIVKLLRTQKYGTKLRELNLNIPPLETVTRWSSFYNMLNGLFELPDFIKDLAEINPEFFLSTNYWESLLHLLEILVVAMRTTKKLQNGQFAFTDF